MVVEDEEERDKEKKRVRKKRKISSDEQDEPVKERRKSRPSLPVSWASITVCAGKKWWFELNQCIMQNNINFL